MITQNTLLSLLELVAENQARKHFRNGWQKTEEEGKIKFIDKYNAKGNYISIQYKKDEVFFSWKLTRHHRSHEGEKTYSNKFNDDPARYYIDEYMDYYQGEECETCENSHPRTSYHEDFNKALSVIENVLIEEKIK